MISRMIRGVVFKSADRVNIFWNEIHCATGTVKNSNIVNDMISEIEIETVFKENVRNITQCAKQAELYVGNTVTWLYREVDLVCELQKKKIKLNKMLKSRK